MTGSRMRRSLGWVIVGTGGIVLVAAAVWFWLSATRSPTPEEAALGYLHALESGDPDTVAATGVPASAETLAAFDAATATIEDAEVKAVSEDSDGASVAVDVAFRLADERRGARLTLTTVDGRWTVDGSGLGALTADTSIGSDIAIGDITAPVRKPILLLPATYTVTPAPAALLAGESTVVVLPGADATTTIEATVRPEATAVAQRRLDAHLESCTARGSELPDGCGIRIPWGTEFREVSDVRYRIEKPPTLTLNPTTFTADGGVLVATVTGTGQDGSPRTTTYRTDSWSLRGDVTFTADGLVLSAW